MVQDLPVPLQDLYVKLQSCQECRLGRLNANKNHWRIHGWGKEREIVFISDHPDAGLVDRHSYQSAPWDSPTEKGRPGEETYLHLALRKLDLCRCTDGRHSCMHKWFITNLIKCCIIKQNLDWVEHLDCVKACMQNYLLEELKLIKPLIIITMGEVTGLAFGLKPGQIRYSFDVKTPADKKQTLADMGIEALVGAVNHPKYYLDKNRGEINNDDVRQLALHIQAILDEAGMEHRNVL